MARPSKPVSVLEQEKKSHRSKAELEARRKAEAALATGVTFKERKSVREDPVAHREFLRVKKLLAKIEKNDALFEGIINRYCEIVSEIEQLKEERARMVGIIEKADDAMDSIAQPDAQSLSQFMAAMARYQQQLKGVDSTIENKRKMLLTIEKETCMTVSAQLRTIPKQEEKPSNPLLEALQMED